MKTDELRKKDKKGYLILPTEFTDKGWEFKQLFREKNVAVYIKIKNKVASYETIIIKKHDGYEIMNNKIPPSEIYPKNEDWGTAGFTYSKEEDAINKAKKLLE